MNRMGPDEMEHLQERYERAEARIAEATDRHDRARAVGRLYEMSWKNPYAAYRAGEISEFGLYGRAPDHVEAANMYLRAHRLGDTRATWRLMLEHPCSAPPEEAAARTERLFMEAALPVRTRRADGSWAYEADDGFIEEAESRAESSPEVRRLLTEALHRARDPRCEVWAERSAADGCGRSSRILAQCLIDDACSAEEPEDGERLFAEAMTILEGADDDWESLLARAEAAFCSRFEDQDDDRALDLLLRASSICDDQTARVSAILPYLEYYAASLPDAAPETRFMSYRGASSLPGRSVRTPYLPLEWSAMPEWALLLRVTRTSPSGVTDYRELRNARGGFEDDMFSISPASTDNGLPDAPASFVFKPTGFEMELCGDCMGVRAVYEGLEEDDMRMIMLACVESARAAVGGLRQ